MPGSREIVDGSADARFSELAIAEARKSSPEDSREHPLVGAVVVKGETVLGTAFRGEFPGAHAEYAVLEKKLPGETLAGATVYTTLEPCTGRNPPKVPCAERLIQRRVARVVVGMLDPNQAITGRGISRLRDANVSVDLFPPHLMAQVEEMNRDFAKAQNERHAVGELIFGGKATSNRMERLFLGADENIRLLIHAVGTDQLLSPEVEQRFIGHIKTRQAEGRVTYRPILTVSNETDRNTVISDLRARLLVYTRTEGGVYVEPVVVHTSMPIGIDVIIVDGQKALLSFITASGYQQAQHSIVFDGPQRFMSQMTAWFDSLRSHGETIEEFQSGRRNRRGNVQETTYQDVLSAIPALEYLVQDDSETTHIRIIAATGGTTVNHVLPRLCRASRATNVEIELHVIDPSGPFASLLPDHWRTEVGGVIDRMKHTYRSRRFAITVSAYAHLPAIHGIMVNNSHLLLGFFGWDDTFESPELVGSDSLHHFYSREDSGSSELFSIFDAWFRHAPQRLLHHKPKGS